MKVHDFIEATDFSCEALQSLFVWASSPEIESSGEGRRQLGYHDGYSGELPATSNPDYMRGFKQGWAMSQVSENA